jgi:glycosyltransferase involved in cell wall biosynthesis
MPGNLNAVISQATGDYIANLHDADEFHPTLLEKWEASLIRHPKAGLVFCGLDAAAKSHGEGPVWVHDLPEYSDGREFFRKVYVASSSSPIWGTVMVRREVYAQHLPFDSQFRAWADVDMWMRICGTHGIAYVPEALIILDHSETQARTFTWEKFLITHRMPVLNIHRITVCDDLRHEWLRLQRRWTHKYYMKHLIGRAIRCEFRHLFEGVGHWRDTLVRLSDPERSFTTEGAVRFMR